MDAVAYLELAEHAGDVGLDGGLADDEFLGALGVGQALGDELEDLCLSVAQSSDSRVDDDVLADCRMLEEAADEAACHGGGEQGLAPGDDARIPGKAAPAERAGYGTQSAVTVRSVNSGGAASTLAINS